jgi:dTDP-L-rhamnose 4-epimerase
VTALGRVLVTGGAGFIGSHVVDQLVERGVSVRVLDALLPVAHAGAPGALREDVEYVWGDLRDAETVARVVRDVDAVSHQGAMVGLGVDIDDIESYVEHNDVGTAVLLRALHRAGFAGPLVLGSSMVVYGEGAYRCRVHGAVRPVARTMADLHAGRFDPPCPRCAAALEPVKIHEDAPVDPRNVYAATKLHQEHLCASFARERGSRFVALRYHNVYGPCMPRDTPYAGVASIVRSALERGDTPTIFEDGAQRRNFVHVHDVARANVLALLTDVEGTYNVAGPASRSVLEMAEALADAFGTGAPRPVVVGGGRLGDVRHVMASGERARRELGFVAEVPFDAGMRSFATAPLRETAPLGASPHRAKPVAKPVSDRRFAHAGRDQRQGEGGHAEAVPHEHREVVALEVREETPDHEEPADR